MSTSRPIHGWGPGELGPDLRLVVSTTLRTLVLITVAVLLILVLLPALLGAQGASA